MTRAEMCERELARLEQLAQGCSLHVAEWEAVAESLRQLLQDESYETSRAAAENPAWATAAAQRERVDELERRLRGIAELQTPTPELAA